MSKADATRAVADLAAAFPRFDFPAPIQQGYVECLAGLQGDVLSAAVILWVQTQVYLPSVAEVKQFYTAIMADVRKPGPNSFGQLHAWAEGWYSPQVAAQLVKVGPMLLPEGRN